MFDFEQLNVYQKTLALNKRIFVFLHQNKSIDYFLQNQLKRASTSIALNIAEGSGRFTVLDRRRFYVIARGSAFEVIAILKLISNQYEVNQEDIKFFRAKIDEISRMLFGLVKKSTIKTPLETRSRTRSTIVTETQSSQTPLRQKESG